MDEKLGTHKSVWLLRSSNRSLDGVLVLSASYARKSSFR